VNVQRQPGMLRMLRHEAGERHYTLNRRHTSDPIRDQSESFRSMRAAILRNADPTAEDATAPPAWDRTNDVDPTERHTVRIFPRGSSLSAVAEHTPYRDLLQQNRARGQTVIHYPTIDAFDRRRRNAVDHTNNHITSLSASVVEQLQTWPARAHTLVPLQARSQSHSQPQPGPPARSHAHPPSRTSSTPAAATTHLSGTAAHASPQQPPTDNNAEATGNQSLETLATSLENIVDELQQLRYLRRRLMLLDAPPVPGQAHGTPQSIMVESARMQDAFRGLQLQLARNERELRQEQRDEEQAGRGSEREERDLEAGIVTEGHGTGGDGYTEAEAEPEPEAERGHPMARWRPQRWLRTEGDCLAMFVSVLYWAHVFGFFWHSR